MRKRTIAIVLELIPVISAPVSYILIFSKLDSEPVRQVIMFTTLLAFLGFVFFFIGRKLAKTDKAVKVLGILDWLATVSVIGFYVLAIFSFGL